MKKWLNNPYFIVVLVVFACAIIGRNFIGGLTATSDHEDSISENDWMMDEQTDDLHLDIPTTFTQSRALVNVSAEDIFWNETHLRDPFEKYYTPILQPEPFQELPDENMIEVSATIKLEPKVLMPKLMAIVAGGQTKMAVLDGTVVNEGSQYREFTVSRITPENVEIMDEQTSYRLTLPEE